MWWRALTKLAFPLSGMSVLSASPMREAPNPSAAPVDQLVVSGNACGPAALLNAFRSGSADWRRASDALAGANDRESILKVIREIGMRPSKNVPGRARWTRNGVSVADLRDIAQEMTTGQYLPQVNEDVFFLNPGETPEKLLRRVWQRIDTSLAKGLPPVVSLRRYALHAQKGGNPAQWVVLAAHFVTITSAPRSFDGNARSFPVSYVDPWGGKRCEGIICIPVQAVLADMNGQSSCLAADFPQTSVGKKQLRGGEPTALAVCAAIGRW